MCACIHVVPTSSYYITLTSSETNFNQIIGSNVTFTCAVELNPVILGSEIFLLTVNAQLFRDGTPLALNGPTVTGTTFTYMARVNLFGRSDSGNYVCTATIRPQPFFTYLTGTEVLSDTLTIIAGKYTLQGLYRSHSIMTIQLMVSVTIALATSSLK